MCEKTPNLSLVNIKLLTNDAMTPTRGSSGSAGSDLYASRPCVVPAHGNALVHTDIAMAIPDGHYGRISPRSGKALNDKLDVGGGIIDSDYRGELGVIIFNHGDSPYKVVCGEKIAQLIIQQFAVMVPVVVDELPDTKRGSGGFGSTGV